MSCASCGLMQWLSVKLSSVFRPKGSTPLPTGVLVPLFVSMFGNAIAMQMLFAFLPDMVKSFGIADEDAGYYVGMLASAVFFGRFITSYFWGWLSDKIGRRQVLLWCTSMLFITTLTFGFAKSFEVAFLIRFITGLIAGMAGAVKASLADVCDESNQALGMSLVVTAWNTGLIIGPAVGGYLANPVEKYSSFKGSSLFENFAYLFPCIVNATICLIGFLLVLFIFPETLAFKQKTKDKEIPLSIISSSQASSSSNRQRSTSKTNQNGLPNGDDSTFQRPRSKTADMMLLSGSVTFLPEIHLRSYHGSTDKVNSVKEEPYVPTAGKTKPGVFTKTYNSMKQSKLAKLCRSKDVRYCVGQNTVFSFASVAEHEMYSLWAATGREFGGLDFSTDDLGFTLTFVGIGCACSNFIVFPQMVKRFGLMKTQFISLTGVMFFTIVLPTTNIFYGKGAILKAAVIVLVLMGRVFQACCYTGHFIMLGNCVTSQLTATVHGFAMSVVFAARTVSSTVAGSMFSWSITSGLGFPFNEKLVFIFIGFVVWLSLVVACCIDEEAVSKPSTN